MGVMGSIGKQASLTSLWCCSILAMATMVAHGDYASDYKECAPTLLNLRVCVPYARKQAPKPTSTCCSKVEKVMQDNHKCLCVLIRYHDKRDVKKYNLDLNRTINLPQSCGFPSKISTCPGLLGIDPNSPEAEIFMGHKSSPAATAQPNGSEEKGEKSGSGRSNYHTMGNGHAVSWWKLEALRGFLIASVMAILAG